MKLSRYVHWRQAVLTWLVVALLVLLQFELLPRFSVTEPTTNTSADKSAVVAQYASLPLAFEPNRGQADGSVSYLVHHGQATTYFDGVNTTTTVGDDRITMSLDGANTPNFIGTNLLESKTNYFIGNDQSKWHSNVPNYKDILATNVYPGIDLKYYGTNSTLEHDFIVNPGADPKQIVFHFGGQQDLSLDKEGNLVLKTASDELHLNAPTTYQLGDHEKHTIPSHFVLDGNTVIVALNGEYDHAKPLVIDPTLTLVYSTYLGGTGQDGGGAFQAGGPVVALDASGNAYIAGITTSTNFPTLSPFQSSNSGGLGDVFVSKLSAAGSALTYSTYLGGTGIDSGNAIAVDIAGNAYITGSTTSTNFPTASPFQAVKGAQTDAFVAKLNPAGSALTYSTYLGGTGNDSADGSSSIAIDANGSAYIVGTTTSTNFPTASAFQASIAGGVNAFITKFNPAGSALVYSTYLGGTPGAFNSDEAFGVVVDTGGSAYVTGITDSSTFPRVSPFQATIGGQTDAFITKFNPAGSALVYSTYLGGSGNDHGRSIVVDTSGNAYIAGNTQSANFPTASPFQATGDGGLGDGFATKLNPAGSALVYSTYLSGNSTEQVTDIDIDSNGNAYITGRTQSTSFPTVSPLQAVKSGGIDAFATKLNPAGSAPVFSTYLGGNGQDSSNTIISSLTGNVYVAGTTLSTNFPTASPFQASNAGGGGDAFITQLTEHTVNLTATVNPTLTFTIGSTSCSLGALLVTQTQFCTYALTAATNGTSGYTISYLPATTLTSGANTITALSTQTASTLNTEQFGINLRANTAVGSHTATNFGSDVSGGSGSVASAYNTANSFKLVAAGDTIATAGSPSLTSTYTVSTIANIGNTTEAGNYTTTLTYNIVAGY